MQQAGAHVTPVISLTRGSHWGVNFSSDKPSMEAEGHWFASMHFVQFSESWGLWNLRLNCENKRRPDVWKILRRKTKVQECTAAGLLERGSLAGRFSCLLSDLHTSLSSLLSTFPVLPHFLFFLYFLFLQYYLFFPHFLFFHTTCSFHTSCFFHTSCSSYTSCSSTLPVLHSLSISDTSHGAMYKKT